MRSLQHFFVFFRRLRQRLRQAPGVIVCLARQAAPPDRGFFWSGFLAHLTSLGILVQLLGCCHPLLCGIRLLIQEQIEIKLAWGVTIPRQYCCGFTAMMNAMRHHMQDRLPHLWALLGIITISLI